MAPTPTLLRLCVRPGYLQADWTNDRHHAADVRYPYSQFEVADALRRLARLIEIDPHLRDNGAAPTLPLETD